MPYEQPKLVHADGDRESAPVSADKSPFWNGLRRNLVWAPMISLASYPGAPWSLRLD